METYKNLIILSGAGDPESKRYSKVYNLIINYAENIGYENIFIQKWKGQNSFSEKGKLSFPQSSEMALELFKKYEEKEEQYNVICRSFGTGIFLDVCQKIELKSIGFASLWGMPSYVAFWNVFKDNVDQTIIKSKDKGLNLNHNFFKEIVPYENLLKKFNQNFKLNMLSGNKDIHCTPNFMDFLKKETTKKNIYFSCIDNLPHEVINPNKDYMNKLFNLQ